MRCLISIVAVLFSAPLSAADHVILVSIDGFAAYHLTNQELDLPNIRELIDEGVWAASSETVFPSVTHPSHTTILTGVEPKIHGVLSNGLFNRETGERFHPTNKKRMEIVTAPTLFDAAKKKGLKTASFFWPETREDPSIDFNIPEVFTPERKAKIEAVDKAVLDELRDAGIPIELYFKWYGGDRRGAGDMILAEAAGHAIRKYKPGLLAIHILVTDSIQHEHGPHHYRSSAALTQADQCIGILKEAVREAGIEDETTFVIGADHGFHSVYHELNIRPAFAREGLLSKMDVGGYGWTTSVRLKESFDEQADGPKLDRAIEAVRATGHLRKVIRPGEFHAMGLPEYDESPYAFGQYMLIPDIDTYFVLDKSSNAMERRLKKTPSHSHGYLPTHPRMYTSLVLSGAGIKQGETIGHVRNLDIAPTIAELLGMEMKDVSGRVLTEALE